MTEKEKYMSLALKLAKKGCGRVSPNPMVGAVIVKNGKIIGEGYHEKYGTLHAERNALKSCTESPVGATIYVTLEPCCHHGKQPPCTEALMDAGIANVVVGSLDPNPLVAGKGIEILRKHGISVETGILKEECDNLNEVFFHYIQKKTPYVMMKYAMTMDGKIASYTGSSKWVTGEIAREKVHQDRNRYSAIMVGVGTVLADNPMLTCRMEGGRNPVRIVCDTQLRTPLESDLVKTAAIVPTILATSCEQEEKWKSYEKMGCQICIVPEKDGHLDLQELMVKLGKQGIDSILLEGGATMNWSALKAGIVQKVQAYIAPKLIGGAGAKSPIEGQGIEKMYQAIPLKNTKITVLGEDILLESWIEEEINVYRNYRGNRKIRED